MKSEDALQERLAMHRNNIPHVDDIPAYKMVQRTIQAAIAAGDWEPEQAIPPEHLFAKHMGVSVGTVKKAMLNMVNEGMLYRRQGSGTYVSSNSFTRQLRRYYLFLEQFDGDACENAITLHAVETVDPVPEINSLLKLDITMPLTRVTRLFREGEEFVLICRSYFSSHAFSTLNKTVRQRFERVPLFVIVEEDYSIRTRHSDELIGIIYPEKCDADLLSMANGEAGLLIKAINYSSNNDPYEYRESVCKCGGKFMFRRVNY